jgi:hypothetical protein
MGSLGQLLAETEKDAAQLPLAIFPLRIQVRDGLVADTGKEDSNTRRLLLTLYYQRRLKRKAARLKLPTLDLLPFFLKVGLQLDANIENLHPGAPCMHAAAQAMDNWISSMNLIPN